MARLAFTGCFINSGRNFGHFFAETEILPKPLFLAETETESLVGHQWKQTYMYSKSKFISFGWKDTLVFLFCLYKITENFLKANLFIYVVCYLSHSKRSFCEIKYSQHKLFVRPLIYIFINELFLFVCLFVFEGVTYLNL